ncbi:hypothetical protein ACRAWG_29145 [Methylobacterium sp. P31]
MPEDADSILEAVAALRARGVDAEPCGEDLERWLVGDFVLDDATLMRLAERLRLVEEGGAR